MGIAVALVVSVVAMLAVPKLREKVLPPVKNALSAGRSVARDRHKRIELFGGNVLSELTYSIALGATCLAYGVHLNLAQLVFVNSSAAVLSSVIPSPGGIGPAEAALAAGLIAMGVDESTAFAVQSRSASTPSTSHPSGDTSHCAGSADMGMSDEASRAPGSSRRVRQHRPSSLGASSVPESPWFFVESRGILLRT